MIQRPESQGSPRSHQATAAGPHTIRMSAASSFIGRYSAAPKVRRYALRSTSIALTRWSSIGSIWPADLLNIPIWLRALAPRAQRSLRVLLQPEYRLLRQALGLRDGREALRAGAVESKPDAVERSPVIGRLAPQVSGGLRSALMVKMGNRTLKALVGAKPAAYLDCRPLGGLATGVGSDADGAASGITGGGRYLGFGTQVSPEFPKHCW